MTAVSAVSDGPPEEHASRITPARTVSARHLARNMAEILRAVADEDQSFAIEHFGRVVGFIVPREGRVLVRRNGKELYEVPVPEPLRELNAREAAIVALADERNSITVDEVMTDGATLTEIGTALASLELGSPPLLVRNYGRYHVTGEGRRHAEALRGS